MGIKQLKKLNEALPDWMKSLAAPIIRNQLIKNTIFLRQYDELVENDNKTLEERKSILIENLRNTLIYAYQKSSYFGKLFEEIGFDPFTLKEEGQLKAIPVMDKDVLRKYCNEIMIQECTNYYSATTGGSTGRPLKIELDKDSIYKEKAFIYHFWARYGYDYQRSRIATFRGLEFDGKYYKRNPLYNEILLNPFMLKPENIEKYTALIEKFRADFLQGYPSAIYLFCCCLEKKKIQIAGKIKAVFLISENIYSFQRDKIQNVLQCEIAAFYGHSERAVFAEQIGENAYEFNTLYGYAEVTSEGKLLCTGFINKRMPLIRYDTEDAAIALADGSYRIYGHRSKEVLYGKSGEEISAAAINFHSEAMANINGYQFVQDVPGKTKMYVVKDADSTVNIIEIQQAVKNKLGEAIDVEIELANHLLLSGRGKYQMIIQNCKDVE